MTPNQNWLEVVEIVEIVYTVNTVSSGDNLIMAIICCGQRCTVSFHLM
jgi:hypothetical protein